jgi:dihydrodipicolinate synthase/N-acetylneuraminate lyase
MLIFDLFRPRTGWLGVLAEHWNRYRLRGGLPIGVVAGPANALPREWARAWQVSRAGDGERMERARQVAVAFGAICQTPAGKRSIACTKRALRHLGVIACDAVAPGTPALAPEHAAAFDAAFDAVRAQARDGLGSLWVSRWP